MSKKNQQINPWYRWPPLCPQMKYIEIMLNFMYIQLCQGASWQHFMAHILKIQYYKLRSMSLSMYITALGLPCCCLCICWARIFSLQELCPSGTKSLWSTDFLNRYIYLHLFISHFTTTTIMLQTQPFFSPSVIFLIFYSVPPKLHMKSYWSYIFPFSSNL